MNKRKNISIVLISLFLLGSMSGVVIGQEENWVEVTRLTGSGGIGDTKTFSVNHVDWRVRWEIESGNNPEEKTFLAYLFPATGPKEWIESIQQFGIEETTGILNIQNRSGSFYFQVLAGSIESYTMIVEQNIDSIPEFPSWTPLLIMLVAVLVVALPYKRRLRPQTNPKNLK